jgi:hypothetical protein
MSKRQKKVFWPLLALAAVSLSALVLGYGRTRTASTKPGLANPNGTTTQSPGLPSTRIEVEPFTLRPNGFEPERITRPKGFFMLAVDNRSRVPDLVFQLSDVNGNQRAGKQLRGRELRWRQLVDLPPGDYVLAVASHPQWRGEIRITTR